MRDNFNPNREDKSCVEKLQQYRENFDAINWGERKPNKWKRKPKAEQLEVITFPPRE